MSGTPRPTRTDPVALIAGILMLLLASGVLWMAFGGPLDPIVLKLAAPFSLVLIGILGLLLSRKKT
ncbi:hypothetical protein [Granulicoccus phenolivorans]|uniref:hypothetical protein n=1 Tax=Granulicoccus phenolivorans TaxID=266854 RepID=UPI0003F9DCB9|nr:hypothetical protein [Granulicoccus phenolivorans]